MPIRRPAGTADGAALASSLSRLLAHLHSRYLAGTPHLTTDTHPASALLVLAMVALTVAAMAVQLAGECLGRAGALT